MATVHLWQLVSRLLLLDVDLLLPAKNEEDEFEDKGVWDLTLRSLEQVVVGAEGILHRCYLHIDVFGTGTHV